MSEKYIWATLKAHLGDKGHLVRIEDKIGSGTPDVNFCIQGSEGWIELKEVVKEPAKKNTPLRVPHFTEYQRNWIRYRYLSRGNVWVLLRILNTKKWFLIDGLIASNNLGHLTIDELIHASTAYSTPLFPSKAVLAALIGGRQ